MSFVHLHCHSHYSILNALSEPKEYLKLAKEQGSPALALTDSGVVYGLVEFYKAAKQFGVKPILGSEMQVAPMGRHNKTPENRSSTLVLLAKNNLGYQNLLKLATFGALEGFYYRPRIDEELLEKYGEGLIALSGSLNGSIPRAILENDLAKAKELIERYQKFFGKDSFYLEIQSHPEVANWSIVNNKLVELSQETGAPLVAGNDCHYLKPEDAEAHDVLLCVQNQKTVKDEHRFRFTGDYSLRSPEDMKEAFRDHPEAIANTLKIAEMCEVHLEFGENKMPYFDTGKETPAKYLRHLCEQGLVERYGQKPTEEAKERLEYELVMIGKMGFETYFLIVHDFMKYAKDQGIVVGPGRGSAAGSIIAYCLGITELDPLRYGLLFERFLNPERISMPDIDIDFADLRRDEVLEYVTNKYGEDHVAQIITFGTLAAKAAIRDSGRALGFSYGEVDAVAKAVPQAILGKYAPLKESIEEDPELSRLYKGDAQAKEILDMACKLEGTIRQYGTHACAVIISRDPLTEHTALQKAAGGKEGIVTQYSMKPCEELGLLKMDFLGLKNLTILETTLGILARTRPDLKIDLGKLPEGDPATYSLLQRGETTGVFQLESAGMKRYLKELKPTEFGDLIAMVSLYRPGPMQFISTYIDGKNGKKKVEYLHPSLEGILEETYGIAIYQEQILEIAKTFAGFTLGEADLLRRAIGKKVASELMAQREKFLEGAKSMGHTEALAVKMFDEVIEPFAGYGFNKSHAACYAFIAYQTAYLKANFPAEFMAALLTSDADNTDRIVVEISECRNMKIEVLAPNINLSRANFTVVSDREIRFGLLAIKGIGEGPVREILKAREEGGSFTSLADFASRIPAKLLNKKTLEALAKSGALDDLAERRRLIENTEEISTFAKNIQKSKLEGQMDLFGSAGELEPVDLQLKEVEAAPQGLKLKWEKEVLGLYVSGHPLQGLKKYLARKNHMIENFTKKKIGKPVKLGGLITSLRKTLTKSGKYMCFGEIEDPTARLPFVLFPKIYDQHGMHIEEDRLVKLEGRLEERGGEVQIVVDRVSPISLEKMLQSAREEKLFDPEERILGVNKFEWPEESSLLEEAGPYVLTLESKSSLELLNKIKQLLEENKGDRPVEIHMEQDGVLRRIKVPFGITLTPALEKALQAELE